MHIMSKMGLMYSEVFANYKAGNGYLCLSEGYNPWMTTNDYYDTPERVTEAYNLIKKSGLLNKLVSIPSTRAEVNCSQLHYA